MQSIPKIFHQIWLGGDLPEPYKYFRDHLLDIHPGWDYMFWNESNIKDLINQDIYDRFSKKCFKADVARYEILLKYGGCYVDTDFLIYKNLEPLLSKSYMIVKERAMTFVGSHQVANSIMAFESDHFLIKECINSIRDRYETLKDLHDDWLTVFDVGFRIAGPPVLSDLYNFKYQNLEIESMKSFYTYSAHTSRREQDYEPAPHVYGKHFWNSINSPSIIKEYKRLPCYLRTNKKEEQ